MQNRFSELIILGTKKGFMGGRISFNPKRNDCPVISVGVWRQKQGVESNCVDLLILSSEDRVNTLRVLCYFLEIIESTVKTSRSGLKRQ